VSAFATYRPKTAIPIPASFVHSALRPLLPVSANEAFLESGHVIEGRRWPTGAISGLALRHSVAAIDGERTFKSNDTIGH
jgi:hypothetical protein